MSALPETSSLILCISNPLRRRLRSISHLTSAARQIYRQYLVRMNSLSHTLGPRELLALQPRVDHISLMHRPQFQDFNARYDHENIEKGILWLVFQSMDICIPDPAARTFVMLLKVETSSCRQTETACGTITGDTLEVAIPYHRPSLSAIESSAHSLPSRECCCSEGEVRQHQIGLRHVHWYEEEG